MASRNQTKGDLPLPARPHQGTIPAVDPLELQAERLSTTGSLAELLGDYVLFSPALLYTDARLDRDPVAEFLALRQAAGACPFVGLLELPEPILPRELGAWSCRLLACDRQAWPDLSGSLGALVVVDRPRRLRWQSQLGTVSVPDVLWTRNYPSRDVPGPAGSAKSAGPRASPRVLIHYVGLIRRPLRLDGLELPLGPLGLSVRVSLAFNPGDHHRPTALPRRMVASLSSTR